TGYWPGAGQTSLPAAPRCGDRVCRPRQVRAAIPAGLDEVACRALPAHAGPDTGPPIRDPAQLADELALITGARSRRAPSATQESAGAGASPGASATAPVPAPPEAPS